MPAVRANDRGLNLVAAAVIVGVIMTFLDTTVVNVGLSTLAEQLDAPLSTVQWVSTGYLLALGIVIPLSGWMSQRFGTKRMWMLSLILFGTCSALCGAAWSAESLIAFRILQGFGGGMIFPIGMSILAQAAGPRRLGRMTSLMSVPVLLGPVMGPVLGGLLVTTVSWRWMFYVNAPVTVVALVMGAKLLHAQPGDPALAGRFDWVGFALVSPGVASLIFGLSVTETHGGVGDPHAAVPLAVGIVLVALFVWHASRTRTPLIDIGLFRNRGFSASALTIFLAGGAIIGMWLILPLYYQVARGSSPLVAGMLMAPQGLGVAAIMPIAGRLCDRVGGGRVAFAGVVVTTASTLPLVFVGADTPFWVLALILVARGVGFGATLMPSMTAAYSFLAPGQVPGASSTLAVMQRVGGSVATALFAVVLQHELRAIPNGAVPPAEGLIGRLPDSARLPIADELARAFAHTFWWAFAMSVLAIGAAFVLARSPSGDLGPVEPARDGAAHHPVELGG